MNDPSTSAPDRPRVTREIVIGALALALAGALALALIPRGDDRVLQNLRTQLGQDYHDCVPLGWYPEAAGPTSYVPTSNVGGTEQGVWLPGLWLGIVTPNALNDPHSREVKRVLDELTRLDLLARTDGRSKVRYTVTPRGSQYFYDGNDLGNNVERWPYMCFSRLAIMSIGWAPSRNSVPPATNEQSREVRFTWTRASLAPWATPLLMAHAVELGPTRSPAEATVRREPNGGWTLDRVQWNFPVVQDRAAWVNHRI